MKKILIILSIIFAMGSYSEGLKQEETVNNSSEVQAVVDEKKDVVNNSPESQVTVEEKKEVISGDSVNDIVDSREIFTEKDVEALTVKELTLPELNRKVIELETKTVLDGEKIIKLETALQGKDEQILALENKVERLIVTTNALEERNKNLKKDALEGITDQIYKSGLLVVAILIGITIILIGTVMLQSNKNRKLIEEWKEFFEINLERIKKD